MLICWTNAAGEISPGRQATINFTRSIFRPKRRREDNRIGAGKADGHQERIDAILIGATAKLQLRFKGKHAGYFPGSFGATKRRARLGEAPVEPQGLCCPVNPPAPERQLPEVRELSPSHHPCR